jgi:hypothetical protein
MTFVALIPGYCTNTKQQKHINPVIPNVYHINIWYMIFF